MRLAMTNDDKVCPLCEREVPELTEHHLVPRSRGGLDTVGICRDCHRQLHALFSNKLLETEINTYEAIMADERFVKYIKWLREDLLAQSRKPKGLRIVGTEGEQADLSIFFHYYRYLMEVFK